MPDASCTRFQGAGGGAAVRASGYARFKDCTFTRNAANVSYGRIEGRAHDSINCSTKTNSGFYLVEVASKVESTRRHSPPVKPTQKQQWWEHLCVWRDLVSQTAQPGMGLLASEAHRRTNYKAQE